MNSITLYETIVETSATTPPLYYCGRRDFENILDAFTTFRFIFVWNCNFRKGKLTLFLEEAKMTKFELRGRLICARTSPLWIKSHPDQHHRSSRDRNFRSPILEIGRTVRLKILSDSLGIAHNRSNRITTGNYSKFKIVVSLFVQFHPGLAKLSTEMAGCELITRFSIYLFFA